MSFSNPAATARETSDAYVRRLHGLLGDQDPLSVLRTLPESLTNALDGLTDDQLHRPERPGKWSLAAVIQHLADSELIYAYRFRMMLAHDEPAIQGYDQDLWADRLGYDQTDVEEALALLTLQRKVNLRLLGRLTDGEWERAGRHSERGLESVRALTRLMAAHDLLHLQQIARVKAHLAF